MERETINTIVNILIKDRILVEKWSEFYETLGVEDPDLIYLKNGFKTGVLPVHSLFTEMLTKWRSACGNQATPQKLCRSLEQIGCKLSAENLQKQFCIKSKLKGPFWFEIGEISENFVGRTGLLLALEEFYHQPKKLITLTGLGGVGKSEVCKNIAKKLNKENNVSCFWLNGDNRDNLAKSITRLATLMDIPTSIEEEPRSLQDIFQDVINQIMTSNHDEVERFLVIIDNADKANEDITVVVKLLYVTKCFVIVTSRNVDVLKYAGEILTVGVLEDSEASALVTLSIQQESPENVQMLCKIMQNFPLALQQAVAYIKQQKLRGVKGHAYKIPDYLKTFEIQEQKTKLLDFPLNEIEHEYKLTTLVTWNISILRIQEEDFGDLANCLLKSIAYFEPDGIHIDFLALISNADVLEAVELIKSYSLIKTEGFLISIHRLIQEVTRVKIIEARSEVQLTTGLLQSLSQILVFDSKNTSSIEKQKLLGVEYVSSLELRIKSGLDDESQVQTFRPRDMPHILCLWRHGTKDDEVYRKFMDYTVHIMAKLTEFGLHREILDFGKEFYTRRIATMKKQIDHFAHFVPGSPRTQNLSELTNLFKLSKQQGPMTDKTLEDITISLAKFKADIIRQQNGGDNDNTKDEEYQVANLLMSQNKYARAFVALQPILDWQTVKFGEGHVEVLKTKLKVGICLVGELEFLRAKTILETILESEFSQSNPTDPVVIGTKKELAMSLNCLGGDGDVTKALSYVLEVSEFESGLVNQDQPEVLQTRQLLADVFMKIGRFEEAIGIYKELLEHKTIRFNDLKMLPLKQKFGIALLVLERFDEGQQIWNEVQLARRPFYSTEDICETVELIKTLSPEQRRVVIRFNGKYCAFIHNS